MARGSKILAGNFGASKKFGFSGEHGSVINQKAPKFSDQYFVEFHSTNNASNQQYWQGFSSKVKSISNIVIQTTSVTVDQYGKRVHVPTRVDFPEVTIEFYDTVEGDTFQLMSDIYSNNFKNNDIATENGALESAIKDVNSGAKFTGHQQLHFFTKIVIYDFFGDIEENNTGTIQKIELINPLVSSISFSPSDYSASDLKTISITLAPENIKITGKQVGNVNVPQWMTEGLDYIEKLAGGSNDVNENDENGPTRLIKQLGEMSAATKIGGAITGLILDDESDEYVRFDSISDAEDGDPRLVKQLGDITRAIQNGGNLSGLFSKQYNQNFRYASLTDGENGDPRLVKQLGELYRLTRLYNAIQTASTPAERAAAQQEFIAARNSVQPMPAQDLNRNYSRTANASEKITSNTKYPDDIPDFTDTVTQALGSSRFNTGTIQDIIRSQLINSFFNGTPFSLSSVGTQIAASIIGNTGVGYGLTAIPTASSRFGLAGDIVRDGLLQATASSNNKPPMSRPTVAPQVLPAPRDQQQEVINTLVNARNRNIR